MKGLARVAPLVTLLAACGPTRPSLPPVPGIRQRVDTTFYVTDGTTRREWATTMRAGARAAGVRAPYLAHTSWDIQWSYAGTRQTARGCEPVNPQVEVVVHYTMPRLASDSDVALEEMLEWRRHAASLWRHEEGHAGRAVRAAGEVRDALGHVQAASCAAVQAAAKRATETVLARYNRLQAEYDGRTVHGARQGAVLILPGIARLPMDTTYRDTLP